MAATGFDGTTIPRVEKDGSGGHAPYVRMEGGTAATPPTGASATAVQGTAAAAAAAVGNPVQIGGLDGSSLMRALVVRIPADGDALAYGAVVNAIPRLLLGDGLLYTQRGNVEGTALVSAARVITTSSPDIILPNHKGIAAYLNVTVASGTGGLQTVVETKDPASGSYRQVNTTPTAITGTGLNVYSLYPGVGTANTIGINHILGGHARIKVIHGDGSSYTYSVGYVVFV